LIGDKDMEPMQPLIDLWLAKGLLQTPQQSQTSQSQGHHSSSTGMSHASS
jgi:hypothetical protein